MVCYGRCLFYTVFYRHVLYCTLLYNTVPYHSPQSSIPFTQTVYPLNTSFFSFLPPFFLQIVLTKSDASSEKEKIYALETCFKELMCREKTSSMPFVHLLSAKSGDGIDHLQQSMAEIISHNWIQPEVASPAF